MRTVYGKQNTPFNRSNLSPLDPVPDQIRSGLRSRVSPHAAGLEQRSRRHKVQSAVLSSRGVRGCRQPLGVVTVEVWLPESGSQKEGETFLIRPLLSALGQAVSELEQHDCGNKHRGCSSKLNIKSGGYFWAPAVQCKHDDVRVEAKNPTHRSIPKSSGRIGTSSPNPSGRKS